MIIKLAMLKRLDVCSDQVALFKKHFGEQVEVTEAACLAHAQEFNWDWAARHLLFGPARKAYIKATASAWRAYNKALASAWKAYVEATAFVWKDCVEVTASAKKTYDEARALAFARAALGLT